jgi:co-chaperonin GroES (HSP10)
MLDPTKVKAVGPWVFVKIVRPPLEDGLQKRGAIFVPNGTMEERMGLGKGIALSVGPGEWNEKKKRYDTHGLADGDRVIYRGFLNEANRTGQFDDQHCFIHIRDILGIPNSDDADIDMSR